MWVLVTERRTCDSGIGLFVLCCLAGSMDVGWWGASVLASLFAFAGWGCGVQLHSDALSRILERPVLDR